MGMHMIRIIWAENDRKFKWMDSIYLFSIKKNANSIYDVGENEYYTNWDRTHALSILGIIK